MSLCNNNDFCLIEKTNKPYILIYHHLDKNTDYSKNYKYYDELVEESLTNTNLEDVKKKFIKLYKKPKLTKSIQFIFIGRVDNKDIIKELKKIEEDSSFKNAKKDILNDFFDYNVEKEWHISSDKEIHFIFERISKDDTINTLLHMIMVYCNITETKFNINNIYLYCDNTIDWSNIIKIIGNRIHEDTTISKQKKYKFDSTLESFNIPKKVINSVFKLYDIPEKNIKEILDNPLIKLYMELYHRFRSLNNRFQYSTGGKLDYPVNSYIFNYWNEDSDNYQENIFKDIEHDKELLTYTISYSSSDSNIFHMYNFNSIYTNLINTKKNLTKNDLVNIQKKFLGKLFYEIKLEDYEKEISTKVNILEYKNIFDKIGLITDSFNKYNGTIIDKRIKSTFKKMHYMNIGHSLNLPPKYDLIKIFNEFKLSPDLPFVKFKNVDTNNEVVYKLFKPITQKETKYHEPQVSLSMLNDWTKHHNFKFETDRGELVELNSIPRALSYKLRVLKLPYGQSLTGIVYKLYENSDYVDVRVGNNIYSDVLPIDKTDIRLGDEVEFKKVNSLYVDIDISKTEKKQSASMNILINLNMLDFQIHNINEILNTILNKVNVFIEELYNIDSLRSYAYNIYEVNINNLLHRNVLSNTYFNDFICEYEYELPNNIPVSYSELRKIAELFVNYVVINEKILLKDEDAEYYDPIKDKWISCKIVESNIDEIYTIKLDTVSAGQLDTLKNIKRSSLRGKNINEKKGTFELIYNRVSKFKTDTPIKNQIIKYTKSGLTENAIINNLTDIFGLTKEEALKNITYIRSLNDVNQLDKLNNELGTYITISYLEGGRLEDSNKIKVYIENIQSVEYLSQIYKFITFFFNLYIVNITHNKNDKLLYPLLKNKIEKKDEIEKIENIAHISYKAIASFEDLVFDDFDFDNFDSFDNFEDKKEVIIEEINEEEQKQLELEKNIKEIQKERKLEYSSNYDDTHKNPVLKRLYEVDPALFKWSSVKNDKEYYKSCQEFGRYPKVISDEQKKYIDQHYPGSYSMDVDKDINCESNQDIKNYIDKYGVNMNKIKCNAIKWGSTQSNKNWYICPKIFDMIDQVSLNLEDLDFEKPFVSKNPNSIRDWRTDRFTGEDILAFGPSYKGRRTYEQNASTKNKSLMMIPKDLLYAYPGLMKSHSTQSAIWSPCCYKDKSSHVGEAFSLAIEEESIKKQNDYIQNWGKILSSKRIGLLSDTLYNYFNFDKSVCKTGERTEDKKCFLRKGIVQDSNSFLNLIADIRGASFTDEKIINKIVENLTEKEFYLLNNGNLAIEFNGINGSSPYQNFLEYLIYKTDDINYMNKNFKYFYEYLTKPHKWLFKNGLHLIIFEEDNEEELYRLICPYFITQFKNNMDIPVALALKKGNEFEPIYYYSGIGNDEQRLFSQGDKMISAIFKLYFNKCKTKIPSKIINLAYSENEHLFTPKYNLFYILDILNNLDYQYKPNYLIRDNYNKIIGVYLNCKLIIPIFPFDENYSNNINVTLPIKYYDDVENDGLLDLLNTIKYYNGLGIRTNNVINIRPYKYFYSDNKEKVNGILTNIGVYVPVLSTNVENLKIDKIVNYFEIDKLIKEYTVKENLIRYKDKVRFDELKDILQRLGKTYKTNDYNIKNYLIIDKIVKGIIINIDILIPLKEFTADTKENKLGVNVFKINNFESYIAKSYELARLSDFRLPILPVRGILDLNDKKYKGITIECNYDINFNENEYFNLLDKSESDYKIIKIIEQPFLDKILNKTISDNDIYMDNRIKNIDKINYTKKIYEIAKYELNLLIHKEDFTNIFDYFNLILYHNALTNFQKRLLLYPLLNTIIDNIFIYEDDTGGKYPSLDIYNTCNTNPGINKLDDELCVKNVPLIYTKFKSVEDYIKFTYTENTEYKSNEIMKVYDNNNTIFKKNMKLSFDKYINNINSIGEKLVKTKFIDTKDRMRSKLIKNKLLDECIMNQFVRHQVFREYIKVIKGEEYRKGPLEEILRKQSIDNLEISNYYDTKRRNLLISNKIFDEVETEDYLKNVLDKQINSIDEARVGKIEDVKVMFYIIKKKCMNNSKKTNIIKLDALETRNMQDYLNKLNTELTKVRIGDYNDYEIKRLNKTKKLIR